MKTILYLILILFILPVYARAPKEFSISRTEVKLNTEGISFKPFRDMKPEQIKPVNTFTLTSNDPNQPKIEASVLRDLWERDNKIVTYKNSLITLSFYKLNNFIPEDLQIINVRNSPDKFVLQSEYDNKKKPIEPINEENIIKWIKELKGTESKLEDKFPKLSYSLKTLFIDYDQSSGKYDFIMTSQDKRSYYVSLKFTGGEERDTLRAMQTFVRYIKIDKVKEVKSSSFQSSKFKSSTKVSPEYAKTIEAVKKQVLNTKGWWFAQTNNYILKSNMEIKKRTFAKKVQSHLEFIRGVYEKFAPPIVEIKAVSVLTIPNTRQEYQQYIPQNFEWSAGIWMPGRKELAISPYTKDEKELLGILRHEAFHQYIHYAYDEKNAPMWFDEGHADLFQSIKQIGSKVTLIEDADSLRTLMPLINRKALKIQKHLVLTYEEFYRNKDLNYPLAWSIVYFLRKAAPLYKDKRYSTILPNLMKALPEGLDQTKLTERAFSGIDLKAFEEDYYKFWSSKSMRSKAQRNIVVPRK